MSHAYASPHRHPASAGRHTTVVADEPAPLLSGGLLVSILQLALWLLCALVAVATFAVVDLAGLTVIIVVSSWRCAREPGATRPSWGRMVVTGMARLHGR